MIAFRRFLKKEYGNKIVIKEALNSNLNNKYIQTNLSNKDKNADIIMYYNSDIDLAIIWNYSRRRKLNKNVNSLSINLKWNDFDLSNDTYDVFYKRMGNERNAPIEKVVVLSKMNLQKYYKELYEILKINSEDEKFPLDQSDEFENNEERKRYSSTQLKRDIYFRESVLENYGYECAICRCNVLEVLDAAHLHGHDVKYNNVNDDDPVYGVCLCANHHRMYDRNMFDFDFENMTLIVNDDLMLNEIGYNEFISKYFGRIKMKK